MTTTTQHKAVKTSSSKDFFGMNSSTWEYRGVRMEYNQTTKRRMSWRFVYRNDQGWGYSLAWTKAELMSDIDSYLDEKNFEAVDGRIIFG